MTDIIPNFFLFVQKQTTRCCLFLNLGYTIMLQYDANVIVYSLIKSGNILSLYISMSLYIHSLRRLQILLY